MPYSAPLTDNERLVVGCLRVLAQRIADRAWDLDESTAAELVDREIKEVVDALGPCSDAFAQETTRYLRQAIKDCKSH